MKFSLISPTFGRPDEVREFLESLLTQDYPEFEVILGDGTPGDTLRPQLEVFMDNPKYPLTIVYEEYLPVSAARNEAAKKANGEYLIFFDSDCIVPDNYLKQLEVQLEKTGYEVFGGPDAAHKDFTTLQKAISYSMTSLFTTGGIRGKKQGVGVFHPRGFNMGIKKTAFEAVGGYSTFRCGEDIELSIRLIKAGYPTGLIPEIYVYHKRRNTIKSFFKQVFRFGAARINIWKRHPEELKLTHLFPSVFMVGMILAVLLLIAPWPYSSGLAIGYAFYFLGVFLDSTFQNKSLVVGFLSIITSVVMLWGYGYGFLKNAWAYFVLRKPEGLKL